jgi:hypothetical protein
VQHRITFDPEPATLQDFVEVPIISDGPISNCQECSCEDGWQADLIKPQTKRTCGGYGRPNGTAQSPAQDRTAQHRKLAALLASGTFTDSMSVCCLHQIADGITQSSLQLLGRPFAPAAGMAMPPVVRRACYSSQSHRQRMRFIGAIRWHNAIGLERCNWQPTDRLVRD